MQCLCCHSREAGGSKYTTEHGSFSSQSCAASAVLHLDGAALLQSVLLQLHDAASLPSCNAVWLQSRNAVLWQSHNAAVLQACDAVLALRGKVKAGGWLRTAAKGRAVPIFSVKSCSPEHLSRAVQTILGIQPSPGGMFGAPRGPDADSVAAPPSAPVTDFDSAWDQEADEGSKASHICVTLHWIQSAAFALWFCLSLLVLKLLVRNQGVMTTEQSNVSAGPNTTLCPLKGYHKQHSH